MDNPDLGPCCICEVESHRVRNIIMLDKEAPIPGRGWGCLACGLPLIGEFHHNVLKHPELNLETGSYM
jgi:hypothetical protein